jgi:transketolase
MPCVEWYTAQPEDYKASILPAGVPKVVIEASVPVGWRDVLDGTVTAIGIDHFGASADAATLYREFGLTADVVVEAANALV